MEVFSSENTSDHFPEMISPFPPSFDSFMLDSKLTKGVSTSLPALPPQKLRPIRCSGKTNSNKNAFGYQPCAEFDAQSGLDGDRGGLCELGFVSTLKDELQEGGEAFRDSEILTPVSEADLDLRIVEEVEIKRRDLPAYSSSSSESEVSGDLLENDQGSHNRKRRKTMSTLEGFMEKLASKVLLKQEMMQNELLETIERKERERLLREEAWKKQEMERLRREEQVRAQETSRNVALISLIKNIMDKDLQMVKSSLIDNSSKDEAEVDQHRYD